jgi:hypothetical protein
VLGVNDNGLIAGYFGSGAQGHPNMGYLLDGASYQDVNFPGSVQTQVTGLNNDGVTVGFYSGMNTANMMNDNSGFYAVDGQNFHTADFPVSRRRTSCSGSTTTTWRWASTPTPRATTTATSTTSATGPGAVHADGLRR